MSKTVVVTGSSKGIGAFLIKKFASLNYNVVINYLTHEKAALELQREVIKKYSVKALVIKADVTNDLEVKEMFEKVNNTLGNIDVLVNNAAYARDNTYLDKTKDEFMQVLKVNVYGPFLVTKIAAKYMREGIVLNISSTDATNTFSPISMDYCASKAAAIKFTQQLALNYTPKGIRVNCLCPGVTETPFFTNRDFSRFNDAIPMGRVGKPEEIANAALFLVSDEASYVSGAVLTVDGAASLM